MLKELKIDSIYNPFAVAQAQIDKATAALGLDEGTQDFLRTPQREFAFSLPVRMDNGKFTVFQGFRVQFNTARGPAKGGIRWHPEETIDTVRALAAWMTWKTSIVDIPLGGGKGGVICDPKAMSDNEKEGLARAYIRAVCREIGLTKDVPAPDVYTNGQVMAWMMDEYETLVQEHQPGVITGKPLALGGSLGRGDATARGGIYHVREAAKAYGIDLKGQAMAIQGFGNAGQYAALLGEELLGMKLVAACDSKVGFYNKDGISVREIIEYKEKNGTLQGFKRGKEIAPEEVLETECTVLFPSALENSINAKNAKKVKCRIVCELANGPTTPDGDMILDQKEIVVIPDFVANSGGVTVSYFEQCQNAQNFYWPEELVHERLDRKMTDAFLAVYEMSIRQDCNLRDAAYLVSIDRVAKACKFRGWI